MHVVGYFDNFGIPWPQVMAPFVSYLELIGGLLIVIGLFTRVLSALSAFEMAVATIVANLPDGFTAATEVTLLMFVIFLALSLTGGGQFALNRVVKTPKYLSAIALLFILPALFVGSQTQAAGGGGGGGGAATPPPPTCSSDTWSCSDWTECSLSGEQTRSCTLTFNCPTVEDPKPEEARICTPECTADIWECAAWSECSLGGHQSRFCTKTFDCSLIETPKPLESQSCQPACAVDTWECNDWGSCSAKGEQSRLCSKTFDCPLAETLKPAEARTCTPVCAKDVYQCSSWSQCGEVGKEFRTCEAKKDCPDDKSAKPEEARFCPGLRCGQLDSIEKRIACRLKLTDEELAQEFKILYFPEYCKQEESKEEKLECIATYQSFGSCWKLPAGLGRGVCAKEKLKLKSFIQEKNNCLAKGGAAQAECKEELKEKIESFIIFHLYELEVQAEELLATGRAGEGAVTDLEVFIENKKTELEKATTIGQWKDIIEEVKAHWVEFRKDII